MPEQIFQLVERNVEAVQVTKSNRDEVTKWFNPEGRQPCRCIDPEDREVPIGYWVVEVVPGRFLFMEDADFRKHFTSPRLPWHPQPPMPHWYRSPSFTDGPPLTLDVKS